MPERYLDILSYAREQGLRLSGFAYEKGINEMVIDTLDEYITEIEIPVPVSYTHLSAYAAKRATLERPTRSGTVHPRYEMT